MTISHHSIQVNDITVEVNRKSIKNLHVGVYPPDGRVRVAAPNLLNDEAIRLAVVSRLAWIRRQQKGFQNQPRESEREMVTGESHYYLGKRYRLNVIERQGRKYIHIPNKKTLELYIHPGSDKNDRWQVLAKWYRKQLRSLIYDLLKTWEPIIGKKVSDYRIKRMKTLWGSCNIDAKRIWLNIDLIRKPKICIEYILVHEMVHLLERHHTERFHKLMDQFMPDWRPRRDRLNQEPLEYKIWY